MTRVYELCRILSLDVVLGAVLSGAMVAHVVGVDMPWVWWWALPLSVWVIYTTDHLLDAYRLKDKAHTPRHLFHHRYFVPLAVLWGIGLLLCLTVIPYFAPGWLWKFGMVMGVLVLIHLGLVTLIGARVSMVFTKEFGVGMIYSVGVWGGPMAKAWPVGPEIWIGLGQFTLLALINLLVFSTYEYEIDKLDGHTSFVRAIGKSRAIQLMYVMGITILVAGVGVSIQYPEPRIWEMEGTLLAMLAILFGVIALPDYFGASERYRSWADAIFLLPGWIVLMDLFFH
ncbi:hypothetical protein [Pontibacter sp. G13]|uniref:hypothetical protein n=1 Tax=Pontibacter sp. G13 TaxID=3074898 RepID=UPI00288A9C1B|nr:hypothetical protein [Pontibacter sp. G13]WNJ18105.1 hypothetical protein RJD25_24910 [Pontibacter sp. G13]